MLTDRSLHCIIKQTETGRETVVVAEELNVSQQYVQQIWAEYVKTGTVHP